MYCLVPNQLRISTLWAWFLLKFDVHVNVSLPSVNPIFHFESDLTLAINLCRLSRGKMHGVDHNKGLAWVGSSVAVWPVE